MKNKEVNMILNGLNTEANNAIDRMEKLLSDYDNRLCDPEFFGEPEDIIGYIEYWECIARDYTRLLFNKGDQIDYFGGNERHNVVSNYNRLKCNEKGE